MHFGPQTRLSIGLQGFVLSSFLDFLTPHGGCSSPLRIALCIFIFEFSLDSNHDYKLAPEWPRTSNSGTHVGPQPRLETGPRMASNIKFWKSRWTQTTTRNWPLQLILGFWTPPLAFAPRPSEFTLATTSTIIPGPAECAKRLNNDGNLNSPGQFWLPQLVEINSNKNFPFLLNLRFEW